MIGLVGLEDTMAGVTELQHGFVCSKCIKNKAVVNYIHLFIVNQNTSQILLLDKNILENEVYTSSLFHKMTLAFKHNDSRTHTLPQVVLSTCFIIWWLQLIPIIPVEHSFTVTTVTEWLLQKTPYGRGHRTATWLRCMPRSTFSHKNCLN